MISRMHYYRSFVRLLVFFLLNPSQMIRELPLRVCGLDWVQLRGHVIASRPSSNSNSQEIHFHSFECCDAFFFWERNCHSKSHKTDPCLSQWAAFALSADTSRRRSFCFLLSFCFVSFVRSFVSSFVLNTLSSFSFPSRWCDSSGKSLFYNLWLL